MKHRDLVGEVFGKLTVLSISKDECKPKNRNWLCKCECGKITTAITNRLTSGHKKSCGCLVGVFHGEGHGRSKEYNAWLGIRDRCYRTTEKAYPSYGGRGIKVCDRWLKSYTNFLADVGRAPTSMHSLDRINNDGNYEPSNVRWATDTEQANNKRNNSIIEYQGQKKTVHDWCRELGLNVSRTKNRLLRGWSVDKAFEVPQIKNSHKLSEDDVRLIRKLKKDGETSRDLAMRFNVSHTNINEIATYRIWKQVT